MVEDVRVSRGGIGHMGKIILNHLGVNLSIYSS